MTSPTKVVLDNIATERKYQNDRFGTTFDDHNKLNDWVTYITHYASRNYGPNISESTFRLNMVKVAALAIAAIEAIDRRTPA